MDTFHASPHLCVDRVQAHLGLWVAGFEIDSGNAYFHLGENHPGLYLVEPVVFQSEPVVV
jgi:hypothetical protein